MNDEKIKQSSFVDHLTELRSRLVKSIIYLFIFFVICYFFSENIYSFLVAPYAEAVKDDEIPFGKDSSKVTDNNNKDE